MFCCRSTFNRNYYKATKIYECDTYTYTRVSHTYIYIYADRLHHTGKIISFCSCSSHHLFFEDFFYSVSSTLCFQSSHVILISLNSLDHELTLTRSRSVPFLIAMKAMRSDSPQDFSVVLLCLRRPLSLEDPKSYDRTRRFERDSESN